MNLENDVPAPAAPADLPSLPPVGRPLGRHLGTGPGMAKTIALAQWLGCTTAQIFPGNPRGWQHVPLPAEQAALARAGWMAAGVAPLIIHAPYLINLASPEDALHAASIAGLRHAFSRGVELGAPLITVHLGSHKGAGAAAGEARLIAAVQRVLEGQPIWLTLLLENNVGAGNSIAADLPALGVLLRAIDHSQVAVCLDTAHLWGAGHDLSTAEGVERAIEAIDRGIGLSRLRLLHVNDSPVPLGSHRDQHAHLGQGQIGYAGLAAWLTHPALGGLPVVLETPDSVPEVEAVRLRAAALLCLGDVEGARALQDGLPDEAAPRAEQAIVLDAAGATARPLRRRSPS
jgi:deoxyribonuclease-4